MSAMFDFYFRPHRFELGGRLYERLGVLRFKRALMRSVRVDPANTTPNAYVLPGRSTADMLAFEQRTRRSELIQLAGLAAAALFLLLAITVHWIMLIPAAVLFAANFHCFILQRFNRIRLSRILQRCDDQNGANHTVCGCRLTLRSRL